MVVVDTDDHVDYDGNSITEETREDGVVRRRTVPRFIGGRRGRMTLLSAGVQHIGVNMSVAAGSDDGSSECNEWAVTIPESTHSFLFTEPVLSSAFWLGFTIAGMSIGTLVLVLADNFIQDVPANVTTTVRISVYMSCFIFLLMEEEILTGLNLLKRVSRANLKSHCPQISYPMFVASCLIRITIGFLFLFNAAVVVVHADEVIEIFYDVLALSFIQQLDDIGFALCRRGGVLGVKMQRATINPVFQEEFYKVQGMGHRSRIIRRFVKGLYTFLLLVVLVFITYFWIKQENGEYFAQSITLSFGDEVWAKANVEWPEDSAVYSRLKERGRPTTEQKQLIFSFFNGVYEQNGKEEGRPTYVEQKKNSRSDFDTQTSVVNPYHNSELDPIVPAEIKWCNGRWIWTHRNIQKFQDEDDEGCNWLARSSETKAFDLFRGQSVDLRWELWNGVIVETEVRISNNRCETDEVGCNLNGKCTKGRCVCNTDRRGVRYLGAHCEIKVKDECKMIVSEIDAATWSEAWMGSESRTEDLFNRPIYTYVKGTMNGTLAKNFIDDELGETDSYVMMFSGLRWYGLILQKILQKGNKEFWKFQISNWHPFWSDMSLFSTIVSEATTRDSPVGVDFFRVEVSDTLYKLVECQLGGI